MTAPAPAKRFTRVDRHAAVRGLYLPFVLLGLGSVVVALSATGRHHLGVLSVVAVAIALSFFAEWFVPYSRMWNRSSGDRERDVWHAVVNEGLQLLSFLSLPFVVEVLGFDGVWPTRLPFAIQVVGAVLVADFGITVGHLLSHRVARLWRFHAVHHSVTRMYGLNGLLKHPLHQLFETVLATTPLILLGLPSRVALAVAALTTIQLLLQHSNADYAVGPFTPWLATNRTHRFHHLKWAGSGDVNFGLFTNVWDHAFGTYSYDPRQLFDSSVLGVEAEPDFPVDYSHQLLYPFAKRSRS